MTDTQTTQKTFEQFCQSFVSDLDAGNSLNLDRVITEAMAYAPFQQYYDKHSDELTELFVYPEEESLQKLRGRLSDLRVFLPTPPAGTENLTQFRADERIASSLPLELVSATQIRAVEQAHKTIREINEDTTRKNVVWAKSLAPEFVENLRKKQRDEAVQPQKISKEKAAQIKKVVEESFSKPLYAESEHETQTAFVNRVSNSPIFVENKQAVAQAAAEFISTRPDITRHLMADVAIKTAKATVVHKTVTNPEVFARALTNKLDEKQAINFANTYEMISQTRTEPSGVDSFGAPAAEIITKSFPGITKESAQAAFVQAWEKVTTADSFIDAMTKRLGKEAIPELQKFILEGNKYIAQYKATSGTGLLSDLVATARPTDSDMQNYIAALYERAKQHAPLSAEIIAAHSPDFVEFYLAKARADHPHYFHFEMGESPFSSIIRFIFGQATKSGVGKTVASVGGGRFGAGILARFGLTKAAGVLVGGPWGWALALGDVAWRGVGAVVGKITGGGILGIGTVAGAFGGYMKTAVSAYGRQRDPMGANGWLFALFLAVFPIALILLNTHNWENVKRFAGQPIHDAGGSEGPDGPRNSPGGTMGPISYTGPQPAGNLQCTNYNVSSREFCDDSGCITGDPLSSEQATIMNGVLGSYNQLGLYNCLLGCPQNNVSFYSGGSSPWYGWAAASRSVVLYDGFFTASGGSQEQARLLAHEMAHTYTQIHPDVQIAFEQEGYCGRLCTYPSGNLGNCSPNETARETFAESAAMYIIGQDLQSLCPKGYAFIDRLFRSCNP